MERVLHSSDLERILGVSARTARWRMQALRTKLKREKGGIVLLSEYCELTGLPLAKALQLLV